MTLMKSFIKITEAIGYLMLLFAIHQPILSIKFLNIASNNLDIRILYYDFQSSNLVLNKTDAVFGIRSSIHCSLVCLINLNFPCNIFSYSSQKRLCQLFPTLNSRSRNLSNRIARIPECPSNFVNLRDYGKCYHVLSGLWNWSDARKKCNEINSHPLVIDDLVEVKALKYFISLPKNYTNLGPLFLRPSNFAWTSAMMMEANRTPFVWKPFQMKDGREPYLPISYFNWAPNQPDNFNLSEYCLNMRMTVQYNDVKCQSAMGVICEIDV